MKITLIILTIISSFGSGWFSKVTWIAGQQTSTGYISEFIGNGLIAIILALVAIGFGVWAILS